MIQDKRQFLKNAGLFLFEIVKAFVISLAIILPIRYFLIQPFYVQGASMEPNFQSRDYLIINEIGYRFNNPERGDVVVFKSPYNKKEYLIKRVIGLPGEKVEIKDNQIYISSKDNPQGFVLKENYLVNGQTSATNKTYAKAELRDNEFYFLGDNRAYSLDSRSFGPVHRDSIIGRAWIRGWPFSKMTIFGKINYN